MTPQSKSGHWTRWIAIVVFVLAAALSYLDRQILAAAAPLIKSEFNLSNADYGRIIAAFSLVYAVSTPFAGLFIDRIGLRLGAIAAMLFWSMAGAATGLAQTLRGLIGCRIALAVGEAAGIPAGTKATAMYLRSRELGLGTALQSIGITVGSIAAPLLVVALAPLFGWRSAFFLSGALGLIWAPIWFFTSRTVPAARKAAPAPGNSFTELVIDPRLWGVAIANALVMTLYSLWMNWTTIYFVQERHLTLAQANQQFAWIPPVFATLGGFFGGWLAFRAIRHGGDGVHARVRICWAVAPVLLITAAIPFMPSTGLAAAALAVSFFGCLTIVNNLQMIPIDLFGPERAAFSGSVLTCSFALMQAVISPLIGTLADHYGFSVVCVGASVLPLAGVGVLVVATGVSVGRVRALPGDATRTA